MPRAARKGRPARLGGRLLRIGIPFAVQDTEAANKAVSGKGLRSAAEAHIYPPEKRDAETVVRDQHRHAHETRPLQRGRNWPGPWRKTPGRVLGTSFVRLYQLTLSGFVGNSCRHLPTCSEYAHEAIARHGLWAGGWMGLFRVLRCGPFGTHGIDRVPEALADHYHWFTPWRYWQIGKKRGEARG
jgi:putative membrane protein insertion efficiency factor